MLSLWKWYCFVLSKVVDYHARAGRKEAFSFFVVHGAILGVLFSLQSYFAPLNLLFWLYVALTAIPTLLLFIRRLHDLGLSTPWVFLTIWPPICFFVFCWAPDPNEPNRFGVTERLDGSVRHEDAALSVDGVEYLDGTEEHGLRRR